MHSIAATRHSSVLSILGATHRSEYRYRRPVVLWSAPARRLRRHSAAQPFGFGRRESWTIEGPVDTVEATAE